MSHYHLIGIGGIGMSGIARLLLDSGFSVSGSDLKESEITAKLKEAGAVIFKGHRAENISGAEIVIYSSAIKADNPELVRARALGLKLSRRAQALAELMADKQVISVSGSHGKTTTTSLIAHLLLQAGLCPTVAIGGILRNIGSNACFGKGDFFVAEADESDGSFLYYRTKYSVVTNIDYEHLDYYKSFENEVSVFAEFINNTLPAGCVFACFEDENLRKILRGYKGRSLFFGMSRRSHIHPENIKMLSLASEFDCFKGRDSLGRFYLSLGGEHNISNSLAAVAVGLELGIDREVIRRALASYQGAGRRLEVKFRDSDYTLIDDYAHHPSEIKATLKAIKGVNAKRIIVVFQPHRYTRTKLLLEEFARSFDLADYLVITDIYPAAEPALKGVSAQALTERIRQRYPQKTLSYLPKRQVIPAVLDILEPGDLLVTLGAGDIVKISDELASIFKGKD